jgi:tRNA nucleotidyltransferase (CCA-adding enzyme)
VGLKVIITHIKADFDAIASAWAAYRLYGCDRLALMVEPEPNVCAFLKKAAGTAVYSQIVKIKPNDIEAITDIEHLIITDCKQKKRLGTLAYFIDLAKEITIYDHHPSYAKDINANREYVDQKGSTTTILVEKLLNGGYEITPFDATLYLLAIYEDTGMLTFSTTTADDVRVVARLIDVGGDVTVVNDYVKREFSREQVFVLNELLMNMGIISVCGVNVAYSFASVDEYIEELAFLTHRMMDMEALDVLFILVRTGPRIVLIGRSKNPNVDAGKIVARFGGGGHPSAASANIKDMELHEAVDSLKITLREHIKPVRFVREIMNSPAKYVDTDANFNEAMEYTLKHNLNHMPVAKNGKTVGILSRKEILQGIKHGLTNEPVSLLMQIEMETVTPNTSFRVAENIMLSSSQKLLPVEEAEKLIGVVTRTDLLRLMHEESSQRSTYEEGAKTRLGLSRIRSVTDKLQSELPAVYYKYLRDISVIAENAGMSVFIVGGFVRDLLMGGAGKDIDLVVEGDATIVATIYAKEMRASLVLHDKYKTATVTTRSGDKIDFATARTEYYGFSGAAPLVESSSLRNDLMRRDFTINAMAIRIDGNNFGQLIDFFGGQRDILDKKIRVLHSLSFLDDPTRIFRALRFAGRFGFILGSHTERLMKHAESGGLISKINGSKLFIELKYILMEQHYLTVLYLLKRYDLLEFIAPGLSITDFRQKQFWLLDMLWERCSPYMAKNTHLWHIRYVLLLSDCPPHEFRNALKKLNAEDTVAKKILNIYNISRFTAKKMKTLKPLKPSQIYGFLKKLNDEELLMLGVHLKKSDILLQYIKNYKNVHTIINGNDLKEMGVPESKMMGIILKDLLCAKIDGIVTTREQEEEYVRNTFKAGGKDKTGAENAS